MPYMWTAARQTEKSWPLLLHPAPVVLVAAALWAAHVLTKIDGPGGIGGLIERVCAFAGSFTGPVHFTIACKSAYC